MEILDPDPKNVTRLASQLTKLTQTGLIHADKIENIQRTLHSTGSEIYFTKREMEVLTLLVKGHTAKKIALALNLSKRTIEHHIENMREKAKCDSKFELMDMFHWQSEAT